MQGAYLKNKRLAALSLSASKLVQDENSTITREEWTGKTEDAYVYGILAREKK